MRKQGGCLGEGASLAEEPGQTAPSMWTPQCLPRWAGAGSRVAASAGGWAPSRNGVLCRGVSMGLGGWSERQWRV